MAATAKQRKTGTAKRAMTDQERLTRERLERFPLSSAADLAGFHDVDYNTCHHTLQSLQAKHLVGGMDAGYSHRKQHRYWVSKRGVGRTEGPPQMEGAGLVYSLLKRITLTESVHLIIGDALASDPERRLLDLQWRFDDAVDAAARFKDGWMAFKWSGIWQSHFMLFRQMERFQRNLRSWRPGDRAVSPGRICFVVPDEWQRELVNRVIAMFGPKERYLIYNAETGQLDGDYDLSGSRGRPPQPDMDRWNRPPDRRDRLMWQVMASQESRALIRTVTTVEQWPGIPRSALKDLTKLNGRSLSESLAQAIELGLVWRVAYGGYAPDQPWLSIVADRDRVWTGLPTGHFSREKVEEEYAGRLAKHDTGAVKLVGWFAAAGCPVAPGWRFRDIMGSQGQIAPDAMIFIPQSPFGPTWFYLEYELEATGPKGARGKVRGYQSPLRSDDFPLLVVCRSNAVQHFERESAGQRVLVAPVNEVRRGNVVGENGTVWRYKGEPVLRLGAGPENLRP